MLGAFVCLAVHLPREAELDQFLLHRVRAHRMAHLGQRLGELVHALRHPDQRSHGIAERRRLDEPLERGHEARIDLAHGLASAALAPHLPLRQRRPAEVVLTAIDGRAGEPRDPGHDGETAVAGRLHLGCREQAPPALIKLLANHRPAMADCTFVDHVIDLRLFAASRNPPGLSYTDAPPTNCDSDIVRSAPLPSDRAALVRDLQRELRRVGCYTGALDGIWNTSTRAAMKAFTGRVNAVLPIERPMIFC